MSYETQELHNDHFLEGMVRCGRITKVKVDKSIRATVTYPDRGFQSHYMVVLQRNTIGYQDHYVPVEGESVWVLMQGKSQQRGVILGSCYTENCPPPFQSTTMRGMMFPDGSYIVYDTANSGNYQLNLANKMTATIGTTLNITCQTSATIHTPHVYIEGDLHCNGTFHCDNFVPFSGNMIANPSMKNADGSGGGT